MNKRLFLIILASLLLLGFLCVAGWFFFIKNSEPKNIYERTANKNLSSSVAQTAVLDTDSDGLRDWEEKLWKTDPNKQDTDGDGYTDKQETILGYDPTNPKSNPQTGKKSEKKNPTLNENNTNTPTNITQVFSKTISSQIEDPSQLNQTDFSDPLSMIDDASGQSLLQFISDLNPQISLSEIKTHNDNSFASIQNYASDLENAIPTNPYPNQTEDDILAEAITTENFKKIDEYISYYKISIKNMKNISVPSAFLQNHKRQIELLMATQNIYKNIKEINNDPLKTVLALQENEKTRQEMAGVLQEFFELIQQYAE